MLPSRLVLGVEADVSFPNLIGGTQVISSPAIGQASYAEKMQFSGTVRGRIGYAPAHWLVYATGGLAWTYEQFTRTQISGMPAGGTAVADTVENLFIVPRTGWTLGAGAEVALPSNWSARLEYLYTDYGSRSVSFPLGAQRFTSDLVTQSIRLGFNYRPGAEALKGDFFAKGPPALEYDNFSLHGQTTYLQQYAFPFRAPYHGPNSLDSNQGRETWDVTLYAGLKLWEGAELWINPEILQGFGLSSTLGVAGFPSGEAYKLGSSVPYTRLSRTFVRQTIDLGGETQKVEAGLNQLAGSQTADRPVITVGKFNIADIFDTNRYAPHTRPHFQTGRRPRHVRARGLGRRQHRGDRVTRHRPHGRGRLLARRQALGPAGRYRGARRRDQQRLGHPPGLLQRRRARPAGRRRHPAEPRP